jgi:hypothetical protein
MIGLIATVLVYVSALFIKFLFLIFLVIGLSFLFGKLRRLSFLSMPNPGSKPTFDKSTLLRTLYLVCACGISSILLTFRHWPGFLYKFSEADGIASKFYNPDILYKSSLSAEILRTLSLGRLENPFFWPSPIAAHHIGAESVASFVEQLCSNPNVVTFALAHWALVSVGLAILLYESAKLIGPSEETKGDESRTTLIWQISFVVFTAFLISGLGFWGKSYSVIAYFNYNPESWWGAFFFLSALLSLFRKEYFGALFFVSTAMAFKISLAPTGFAFIGFILVMKRHEIFSKKLFLSLSPVLVLALLFILSLADNTYIQIRAAVRDSLYFQDQVLWDWSIYAYQRLLRPIYLSCFRLIPGGFEGLFLAVGLVVLPIVLIAIGSIIFRPLRNRLSGSPLFPLRSIITMVFYLFLGLPLLIFKTNSPVHDPIDPWITNIWMGAFMLPFAISTTAFEGLQSLKMAGKFGRSLYKILPVLALVLVVFIRPDPALLKSYFIQIPKKIEYLDGALKEDRPYYAAFFGKRIHEQAGNPFGKRYSVHKYNLVNSLDR